MLAIKLKRTGKKRQPSFRIVVMEKRSKLQGRFIDDLGWLNPKTKEIKINQERVNYWLKNGAQPTDSVYNLLVRAQVVSGPKKPVHKKSKGVEEIIKSGEAEIKAPEASTEAANEAPPEAPAEEKAQS